MQFARLVQDGLTINQVAGFYAQWDDAIEDANALVASLGQPQAAGTPPAQPYVTPSVALAGLPSRFWMLKRPTPASRVEGICIECSLTRLAYLVTGGLPLEEIVGFYAQKADAIDRAHALVEAIPPSSRPEPGPPPKLTLLPKSPNTVPSPGPGELPPPAAAPSPAAEPRSQPGTSPHPSQSATRAVIPNSPSPKSPSKPRPQPSSAQPVPQPAMPTTPPPRKVVRFPQRPVAPTPSPTHRASNVVSPTPQPSITGFSDAAGYQRLRLAAGDRQVTNGSSLFASCVDGGSPEHCHRAPPPPGHPMPYAADSIFVKRIIPIPTKTMPLSAATALGMLSLQGTGCQDRVQVQCAPGETWQITVNDSLGLISPQDDIAGALALYGKPQIIRQLERLDRIENDLRQFLPKKCFLLSLFACVRREICWLLPTAADPSAVTRDFLRRFCQMLFNQRSFSQERSRPRGCPLGRERFPLARLEPGVRLS